MEIPRATLERVYWALDTGLNRIDLCDPDNESQQMSEERSELGDALDTLAKLLGWRK